MWNIIEGINVLGIAICFFALAVMLPVRLSKMIPRPSLLACAVCFITLGAYLLWISGLFFGDRLGDVNYTWQLISIRGVCLVCAVWFTVAVFKCNGYIYPQSHED